MKKEHTPIATTPATAAPPSETAADGSVVVVKEEEPSVAAAAPAAATSASATAVAPSSAASGGAPETAAEPLAAGGADASGNTAAITTTMDVDHGQPGSSGIAANDTSALAVKTEDGQLDGAAAAAAAAVQEKPNGIGKSASDVNGDCAGAAVGGNGAPTPIGSSTSDVDRATTPKQEHPEPLLGTQTTTAVGGDDDGSGISRSTSASGRPARLPLDPASVHPAFAGRRPLYKHESPASGRAYGLWDPAAVHPVYFGHLRHDGEAAGAAGLSGWTGAGDGGVIDRALRILRGAADSEAAAAATEGSRNGEGGGGKGREVAGVAGWSAEERATVLGLLCEQASVTGVALNHMNVGDSMVQVVVD